MHNELTNLIRQGKAMFTRSTATCPDSYLADYLIEHNVFILPCKVGDTVYFIDYNDYKPCLTKGENGGCCPHLYSAYGFMNNCRKTSSGVKPTDCTEIKPIIIESTEQLFKLYEYFGKTIFLSLEAAEKARSV